MEKLLTIAACAAEKGKAGANAQRPTKLNGNPTGFAILFTFVTKLQKLVRWFDGINEKKKRITRDAISRR